MAPRVMGITVTNTQGGRILNIRGTNGQSQFMMTDSTNTAGAVVNVVDPNGQKTGSFTIARIGAKTNTEPAKPTEVVIPTSTSASVLANAAITVKAANAANASIQPKLPSLYSPKVLNTDTSAKKQRDDASETLRKGQVEQDVIRAIEAKKKKAAAAVDAVNAAADTAHKALFETTKVLAAVGRGMIINRTTNRSSKKTKIDIICETAVNTANAALTAANNAAAAVQIVVDLEKKVNVSNAIADAVIMSDNAAKAVIDATNKVMSISNKNIASDDDRRLVITAKSATVDAMKAWDNIYNMIKDIPHASTSASASVLANASASASTNASTSASTNASTSVLDKAYINRKKASQEIQSQLKDELKSTIWKNNVPDEIASGKGIKKVNAAAETVPDLVEAAAVKAYSASTNTFAILNVVGTNMTINNNALSICETAVTSAREAAAAATEAAVAAKVVLDEVAIIHKMIKTATKNSKSANMVIRTMPMSKRAEAVVNAATMIEDAANRSNAVASEIEKVVGFVKVIKNKQTNAAVDAKSYQTNTMEKVYTVSDATTNVSDAWNTIYDTIDGIPQAGGRNRTQRKHKHKHMHNTLHKR